MRCGCGRMYRRYGTVRYVLEPAQELFEVAHSRGNQLCVVAVAVAVQLSG